jgi:hypothetical protein
VANIIDVISGKIFLPKAFTFLELESFRVEFDVRVLLRISWISGHLATASLTMMILVVKHQFAPGKKQFAEGTFEIALVAVDPHVLV